MKNTLFSQFENFHITGQKITEINRQMANSEELEIDITLAFPDCLHKCIDLFRKKTNTNRMLCYIIQTYT